MSLDFNSVKKPGLQVYLTNPNSSYNISYEDVVVLAKYLHGFKIELLNVLAVSTQGAEYDKKWIVDNGYSLKEPMYFKGATRVTFNDGVSTHVTEVLNHTLSTLAINIKQDPRWQIERLLEGHGISGKDLALYYQSFSSVQEAIKKLF